MLTLAAFASTAWSDEDKGAAEGEMQTYLGVHVAPLHPATAAQLNIDPEIGLVVDEVDKGSPAEKVGIQKYDILLKLDDQVLIDARQIGVLVRSMESDDEIALTLLRKGEERLEKVKLDARLAKSVRIWKWHGEKDFHLPLQSFGDLEGNIEYKFNPDEMRNWSRRLGENFDIFLERIHGSDKVESLRNLPRILFEGGDKTIRYEDGSSELEYLKEGDARVVVIRDGEGREIFRGPLENEGDLSSIPVEHRGKIQFFQHLERDAEDDQYRQL